MRFINLQRGLFWYPILKLQTNLMKIFIDKNDFESVHAHAVLITKLNQAETKFAAIIEGAQKDVEDSLAEMKIEMEKKKRMHFCFVRSQCTNLQTVKS